MTTSVGRSVESCAASAGELGVGADSAVEPPGVPGALGELSLQAAAVTTHRTNTDARQDFTIDSSEGTVGADVMSPGSLRDQVNILSEI